jgi:hypothetical protein
MQWVPGIDTDSAYFELAGEAIEVAFRGVKIRVCGIEHLRTMKRTASPAEPSDRYPDPLPR